MLAGLVQRTRLFTDSAAGLKLTREAVDLACAAYQGGDPAAFVSLFVRAPRLMEFPAVREAFADGLVRLDQRLARALASSLRSKPGRRSKYDEVCARADARSEALLRESGGERVSILDSRAGWIPFAATSGKRYCDVLDDLNLGAQTLVTLDSEEHRAACKAVQRATEGILTFPVVYRPCPQHADWSDVAEGPPDGSDPWRGIPGPYGLRASTVLLKRYAPPGFEPFIAGVREVFKTEVRSGRMAPT